MNKARLYVMFGLTSLVVQLWGWHQASLGQPVPRMVFLFGPCALFFLFMGLHPDYRGASADRTPTQQKVVLGLLTACTILAFYNYRHMAAK